MNYEIIVHPAKTRLAYGFSLCSYFIQSLHASDSYIRKANTKSGIHIHH